MCMWTISLNSRFRYPSSRMDCGVKKILYPHRREFYFSIFQFDILLPLGPHWVVYYCTQTTGTVPYFIFFIILSIILGVRPVDIPTSRRLHSNNSLSLTHTHSISVSLYVYTCRWYVFILKCKACFGFIALRLNEFLHENDWYLAFRHSA